MTNVTRGRVPAQTLGIRLRMALGECEAQVMAADLGVSRATVSKWIHDKAVPRLGYIRAWAMITDTDFEWLLTGQASEQDSLWSQAS